jgi:hypothetical protein
LESVEPRRLHRLLGHRCLGGLVMALRIDDQS